MIDKLKKDWSENKKKQNEIKPKEEVNKPSGKTETITSA